MKSFLPSLFLLIVATGAWAEPTVPEWSKEAVWYQIFPERFRDGDPSNSPTRETLEWPVKPSEKWKLTRWTSDWYARDEWETEQDAKTAASGEKDLPFYQNGVFDRRYGGDLQGVLDKLDYIQELGFNAIYFNPVFYARSMHKYDGNSFHHVDPYFGPDPAGDFAIMDTETADPKSWQWTSADKLFLELLKQAHARGIRVIIDGVFNHTGRDFFAFADVRQRGEASPYGDWYQVEEFDDPDTVRNEFDYRGWWGHKTLPVFAASADGKDMAEGPKQYVFDATRRWMDPNGDGDPEDGIDGWRLDVADERPAKFWADWNALVFELNPEAYTTAEVWSDPLEMIHHGNFSATMNYYGFAYPTTGFLVDENISATKFGELLDERRGALPVDAAYAMQNLMDSHDTDRLASMVVNGENHGDAERIDFNVDNNPRKSDTYEIRKPNERDRAIQRLVVLFQMTYVGAPMVFYGTEAGMWGGNDPDDRMPMVWPDLTFDPQAIDPRGRERVADEVKVEDDVLAFYKRAIALRREHPALNVGDYRQLGAFDDQKTFVFARGEGADTLVVAMNRSDAEQRVDVELPSGAGTEMIFSTSTDGAGGSASVDGGRMTITLPALTGAVFGAVGPPETPE